MVRSMTGLMHVYSVFACVCVCVFACVCVRVSVCVSTTKQHVFGCMSLNMHSCLWLTCSVLPRPDRASPLTM